MVATAVIGAVSTIGGAAIQSSAANKAAKAQENAAARANATEQGFFDTSQENLAPFIKTGTEAGQKIEGLQGLNGGDSSTIQSTLEGLPGYQFANTQGLKSTQNSATARGLGVSGAAQKGAATYSTGLANSYYNNLLEGLQNTQSTGANAASGLATAATTTGGEIASNQLGAGNAAAAGNIASGQAFGNIGTNTIPGGLIANKLFQGNGNSAVNNDFLAGSSGSGLVLPDPNSAFNLNLGSFGAGE